MDNHEKLKQVAKQIFIKTNSPEYAKYIITELETEENASCLLKYMKSNPEWTEKELTRKALFIAGVLKCHVLGSDTPF